MRRTRFEHMRAVPALPRIGWTGRAPAPNGSQSAPGACQERSTTMPRTTTLHAVTTIGIDMGKNTLHLIGLDARGAIVLREKVARGRIALRLANLLPCLIGIEAGMATHYVARELAALGHDVKQVPATYAKPFRQGHKNDFRDAHAVAEAVQRPTTRFVPAKTIASGAVSPRQRANRGDQSDSWLSSGTRHRGPARTPLSSPATA